MGPLLYLDSDGVFADFDQHFFNLFGKWPRDVKDPQMWAMINSEPSWWTDMPLKPGALELWDAVKHLNPPILTGCPKTNYELAAEHKRVWWKTKFDHEHVITCLSRDKALHMKAPGAVLVDDMIKNIRRWEAAGGVGVYFKNHEQAIERLRELKVI